ncbi:hypothetical protein [Mycolicibacterium mageritense]|uniref:hypothetical protein n=1 Tax=Mycolicibacterium mageritense TaxID=53462 RepID=UPI0011D5B336|nr:hypothetical protein [Mycolicibacterium mageritense]TXI56455.1 MAG: hypothetical protein E6Q55_28735 [Mycolicibacterium mageritense]
MSNGTDSRQAKVYTDLSEFIVYLSKSRNGFSLPDFRKWRVPDAVSGIGLFLLTIVLTIVTFGSGYARYVLIIGLVATVLSVWLLGKLPKFGPDGLTRLRWFVEARAPRTTSTHLAAALADRAVDPRTGRLVPLTRAGR